MLEKTFISVLNMSLIGSYVIVLVLIARLLLKKAPKIFSYALWGIVLFRLLCPFSFESVLSLIPAKTSPIPQDIIYSAAPKISTGINAVDSVINPILPVPNDIGTSINPIQIWLFIGAVIWVFGMVVMLIYSVAAFVKLKKTLVGAVLLKDNIYATNHIPSPFVMGIFKPRVYLPFTLSSSERSYIVAHEMCHINRLDHVTRILGFLALTIHWFNPLAWVAFITSGKDMEMAADEGVMKNMNQDIRAEYSQSLLQFGTVNKMIHATPLAFGEGDTKNRVKNVLSYKKPAFWVLAVSIIAVLAVGVGLGANPREKQPHDNALLNDRRPMIMVGGGLYFDTGKEVPVKIEDSAILGEITSAALESEKPTKNGQCNFSSGVGAKYAVYEDGMAVLLNSKWFIFKYAEVGSVEWWGHKQLRGILPNTSNFSGSQ